VDKSGRAAVFRLGRDARRLCSKSEGVALVALSTVSGACYGLNAVGSRIWHLMANPVRVGDLCTALEQEFDVDRDTCEREVLDLLKQALAEGMIKVEERSVAADERAA
jgi:hypothetical protein